MGCSTRTSPHPNSRLAILQPVKPGIAARAHLHPQFAMHVAAHSFDLPVILVHYFFLVTVYLRRGQLDTLPAAINTSKLRTPTSYTWKPLQPHHTTAQGQHAEQTLHGNVTDEYRLIASTACTTYHALRGMFNTADAACLLHGV